MERHAVLYDRDCGFCRWALALVLRLDSRRLLRPVALQDPEADLLLSGMPLDERMASWHLVDPGGRVRSAGAALPPLLRLLPRGERLAPLAQRLGARGYRFVAGRRSLFGKLVTDRARRRADAVIAGRR